jgi:two-component system, LytTR family, sensor kinase
LLKFPAFSVTGRKLHDVANFVKKQVLKERPLLFHFLFWAGIYTLWVIIFRSYSISLTKTMTIEFCYLIFITADYYIINYFIVPEFLFKRKYGLFVISILLTVTVSAWARSLIAQFMNGHYFHSSVHTDFPDIFFHSLLNISLWVLLITIGKMMTERLQTEQQLEFIEKEKVKNELDYLKAQINPHTLFNSLNTIYGNIDKTNPVARNTLLQFSELLRYQLYECGEEKVSLEKEIVYINNFISFHRLRKADNLRINFQIEELEPGLKIAPLLLIVLIENAFKFVSNYPDKENKICIRFSTKGKVLHSSFSNTKELQEGGAGKTYNGIGIANLKRRLDLLYNDKYRYFIKDENDYYESNLTIDLS